MRECSRKPWTKRAKGSRRAGFLSAPRFSIAPANSWAGSFGFSYNSLSRRTQMTSPNGITTNYTYDSLSRLLSVLHQEGGIEVLPKNWSKRREKSQILSRFGGIASGPKLDFLESLN
jgi:YD repeat-containing protein